MFLSITQKKLDKNYRQFQNVLKRDVNHLVKIVVRFLGTNASLWTENIKRRSKRSYFYQVFLTKLIILAKNEMVKFADCWFARNENSCLINLFVKVLWTFAVDRLV